MLNAGIKGEFAGIKSEFAGIKGELAKIHARMDTSAGMAAAEFKSVRAEIANSRAEAALLAAKQTRTMVITLAGFALTVWITMLATGLS